MSVPILESHWQVGDSTQAREEIQENTHATARKEYRKCKQKLTGLQIKEPRSCDHPRCLVEQVARSWRSEAAASENNPVRRSVGQYELGFLLRLPPRDLSLHHHFEQARLRRRRDRLHEVRTALYPSCSALGPEISDEAAIRYVT